MRLAAKVDANHAEIVKAFRALGCSVLSLAAIGKGCPDLLISKAGKTMLVEVKMPGCDLNTLQREFKAAWAGWIGVVRDLEGVETIVRMLG